MVRFGRWFIALFMVVMLAGLVPQTANAQVIVRVGPHRRYHHPHHRYYRHHRRWHR